MNTKIVFMGSPDFSTATLQSLAKYYNVVGVVTQPDRPAGRGRKLASPPVKTLALKLGLPFIQPERLRESAAMTQLQGWNPDLIVVAAFGQLLLPEVLDLPAHGCLNIHASLLPRWRGAAPINAAILAGDHESGITLMQMDPGLDTGPIIRQRAIPISSDETAGSLFVKLAQLGADFLIESLPAYLRGELSPHPQDASLSTFAPMLKKSDGKLDFNQPAEDLARRVRAFNPWPGTYILWGGKPLKIHRAQAINVTSHRTGGFIIFEGFPAIGTSEGLLILNHVQPAGKSAMPGKTFLRGARNWEDLFSSPYS